VIFKESFMRVFVTGGSEFVGRRMIRMLCDRGDEVVALARSEQTARQVTELGAKAVRGDLLITRTMVRLIGQELTFTDRKAQQELGYTPIVTREFGLAELAID
jgi:NAD(P)-dependent dehydrogenase (short-subunit alcohol dehydrogenase family)